MPETEEYVFLDENNIFGAEILQYVHLTKLFHESAKSLMVASAWSLPLNFVKHVEWNSFSEF